MKALILKNKVVQVENDSFPVHKDFTWMDCPNNCEPGWVLDNGQLRAQVIPEPSIDEKITIEMPGIAERLEALWDFAVNADNTKVVTLDSEIQAIYDKYGKART